MQKKVTIRGEEFTLRDSGITLETWLSGVNHENRSEVVKEFTRKGDVLQLIPEENNRYDRFALMVVAKGAHVGYIPDNNFTVQGKERIFKGLYAGEPWVAYVKEKRKPSDEFPFYNVFVEIKQFEEKKKRSWLW